MIEKSINVEFEIETLKINHDGLQSDYIGFQHGSIINGVLTFKKQPLLYSEPFLYIDLGFVWPRSFKARNNSKYIVGCESPFADNQFFGLMTNQFFATLSEERMKGEIAIASFSSNNDSDTSGINLIKLRFDIAINSELKSIL